MRIPRGQNIKATGVLLILSMGIVFSIGALLGVRSTRSATGVLEWISLTGEGSAGR